MDLLWIYHPLSQLPIVASTNWDLVLFNTTIPKKKPPSSDFTVTACAGEVLETPGSRLAHVAWLGGTGESPELTVRVKAFC